MKRQKVLGLRYVLIALLVDIPMVVWGGELEDYSKCQNVPPIIYEITASAGKTVTPLEKPLDKGHIITLLEKSLDKEPTNIETRLNLAYAYLHQRLYRKALDHYLKACIQVGCLNRTLTVDRFLASGCRNPLSPA